MTRGSEAKSFMVTGASGFLGYWVCRDLCGRDIKVIGIDLADFDYPDISDKVTFFKGDIRDAGTVSKAMQGAEVVVHSAAVGALTGDEK